MPDKQKRFLVRIMAVMGLEWEEYEVTADDEEDAIVIACDLSDQARQFGGCWDSEVSEIMENPHAQ